MIKINQLLNKFKTYFNTLITPIEISREEVQEVLGASEGEIQLIYGPIGSGKSYYTTYSILEDLMQGKVVYCSFDLNFDEFDERKSFFHVLAKNLIFRSIFIRVPRENFHYINFFDNKDPWEKLENLTDCVIYLDDVAVILFDAYEKTNYSKFKRLWLLHTRHFNRTIKIVVQRPTAVQITARSQVNRFYKMEKIFQFGSLIRFKRSEFQNMSNDTVDETQEPDSVSYYWGRKRIFNAYNSWYLRGDTPMSQQNLAFAWNYPFFARLKLLFDVIISSKPFQRLRGKSSTGVKPEVKTLKTNGRLNTTVSGKQPLKEVIPLNNKLPF